MSVTRYSPWSVPVQNPGELRELMEKFFRGGDDADQSNVVTSQWAPRVDIREEAARFVIQADVPGVDPGAIEINMEKGILSIKGERKIETKEESEKFTRVERQHGVFYRRFALPDSADPDNISATGKHGVLEIVIPKRPQQTPRRIAINH
jgi:HSP20 family protein